MRRTNWRFVIVGLALIVLAAGFFVVMVGMAKQSNDPIALMQTVGTVSGLVGALGAVMAIVGLIGRRQSSV